MKAFIDSNIYISIINRTDPTHKEGINKMKYLVKNNFELFTSNYIIAETTTILSQRISKKIAEDFRNDIYKGNAKILITNMEIEEMTWNIFLRSTNKNIGYVDYTSIAFCKKFNIENLVTLDKDLTTLFNTY
ncbi:PIN domain-containing protein [Patescibacteria group bacterium]|nr:PIN domain-containing protein [Patescibacteria group bacterium]